MKKLDKKQPDEFYGHNPMPLKDQILSILYIVAGYVFGGAVMYLCIHVILSVS